MGWKKNMEINRKNRRSRAAVGSGGMSARSATERSITKQINASTAVRNCGGRFRDRTVVRMPVWVWIILLILFFVWVIKTM